MHDLLSLRIYVISHYVIRACVYMCVYVYVCICVVCVFVSIPTWT